MKVKSIFSSKTFWFNVASAALLVLQEVSASQLLSPEKQVIATLVGNILLRFITNQPVNITGK